MEQILKFWKRTFESIDTARKVSAKKRESTYIIAKRRLEAAKQRLVCEPLIRTGLLGSCKLYTQCLSFLPVLVLFQLFLLPLLLLHPLLRLLLSFFFSLSFISRN